MTNLSAEKKIIIPFPCLTSLTPSLSHQCLQRLTELTSSIFALLADLGEDVGDGRVHILLGGVARDVSSLLVDCFCF